MYSDIPMGMYFNGKFNNYKLTNEATKYVSTSYDTGTSYGLRICTRFSVMPNGRINSDSDITITFKQPGDNHIYIRTHCVDYAINQFTRIY